MALALPSMVRTGIGIGIGIGIAVHGADLQGAAEALCLLVYLSAIFLLPRTMHRRAQQRGEEERKVGVAVRGADLQKRKSIR